MRDRDRPDAYGGGPVDVVEVGEPDRARPRRAPLLALVALLALLAVGVVVNARDPADRENTGREPALIGAASIGPETPPPPLETRDPSGDEVEPSAEWALAGVREPTGLYLAGAGSGLTVTDVDADSTDSTPVGGNDLVRVVGRLGGGWLAFTGPHCQQGVDCRNVPLYVVRGGKATKIGEGNDAFPDPDGRTVWVTGRGNALLRWVERRTVTGERVGERTPLAEDEVVVGVTSRGPVVSVRSPYAEQRGATLIAADRRRVLVEPGKGRAVAAAGNLVVWAGQCLDDPLFCHVFTVDVRTAKSARGSTGRLLFSDAVLDPTGRYVAVLVGEATNVVVVDLARREETYLPDMKFGQGDAMAWSPDGKWLVLTHELTAASGLHPATQVAVWRPGWTRAELAVTLDGDPGEFVLAYEH